MTRRSKFAVLLFLFGLVLLCALLIQREAERWQAEAAPVAASPTENPAGLPGTGAHESSAAGEPEHVFEVRGVVQRFEEDGRVAVIEHEEIPDYMRAMTMPFNVKDPGEVDGIEVNDQIRFRFVVMEDESWIEKLELIRKGPRNLTEPRREFRLVRDVEPIEVGDRIPDYTFTNQFEKPVSLQDFEGKAVALTFIFTRCPVPDFCPRMTKNFAGVQKALESDPEAPDNWHLVSLSFDVDFDTPARLKGYAEAHGYDPGRWSYLTGALIDIDAITEQFGLVFFREQGSWNFAHKLRTVVIDTRGRVHHIFTGNSWKDEELIGKLKEAALIPEEAND